jgi:hypothetical protein
MDDIRSAIAKAMAYNRIRFQCKNLKPTTMPTSS